MPQSALAALMGYTDRHLRRLQAELQQAGLIDYRAWATEVNGQNMYASTIWAIKTGTSGNAPRLRADDYEYQHRNFAADLRSKNTVRAAMSGLEKIPESELEVRVFQIAVTGRFTNNLHPLLLDRTSPKKLLLDDVSSAVLELGSLADARGQELRQLVQMLAGWLSTALHDSHSFRWWCGQLWDVAGSWEKIGALQAKLHRFIADLVEFDGIRCPAAWFNARV